MAHDRQWLKPQICYWLWFTHPFFWNACLESEAAAWSKREFRRGKQREAAITPALSTTGRRRGDRWRSADERSHLWREHPPFDFVECVDAIQGKFARRPQVQQVVDAPAAKSPGNEVANGWRVVLGLERNENEMGDNIIFQNVEDIFRFQLRLSGHARQD